MCIAERRECGITKSLQVKASKRNIIKRILLNFGLQKDGKKIGVEILFEGSYPNYRLVKNMFGRIRDIIEYLIYGNYFVLFSKKYPMPRSEVGKTFGWSISLS